MTSPTNSSLAPSRGPLAFRVAAGLCAVVGVLSVIGAFAVSTGGARAATSWFPLAINLTASLAMCGAAIASLKGSRWGVWLIVLAWALPNANNVAFGASLRPPSLLMVLAFITLIANWNSLR